MNTDIPSHLANDRILSVRQYAALLGVSVATLRRMRRAGRIPPPIQLGERRIGWRTRDALAAIEARRLAA